MPDKTIDSPHTLAGWIMPWPEFEVDWRRTGLIVIDLQNYSSNPNCGIAEMIRHKFPQVAEYYLPRIEQTVANTRRLLQTFRSAQREIVYTRHGALLSDGRDMILRRQRRDQEAIDQTERPALWAKGDDEHNIVEPLAPRPNELVIDKNASSAFNGTGIDQLLRNLNLQTLIITGMATDMCVETTARDAADRGYNVIVVEDATATFFPEHHRAALSSLARVFTKVWTTDEVIAQLRDADSAHPE